MKSQVTDDFIGHFQRLPRDIQERARRNYRLWKANPHHPSLHFRRVHPVEPLYSVRVGLGWRVLGLLDNDTITWFWIGSHADYDRLIRQM